MSITSRRHSVDQEWMQWKEPKIEWKHRMFNPCVIS
jgi:hypothetical protein